MARWRGLGHLGWFLAACVAVEALLSAAELGGAPWLRGLAYGLGAFRPELLAWAPPAFALQPVTMFLTHALLHDGILHLVGNMLALAALGQEVARRMGQEVLGRLCLVSALGGALGQALLGGAGPMVGASGVAFGLAGALAAHQPRRQFWRVAGMLAAMNLGLWVLLAGQLAWAAHLGGFLAGLIFVGLWGRGRRGLADM